MSLPIDEHLETCAALVRRGNLVLVAEPGAGKTTRLPPHLVGLSTPDAVSRRAIVLEPRRLAARMAATRIAETIGEPVGARCGYEIRFDRVRSAETCLTFMTEGMFVRQLERPQLMDSTDLVIFDEIHERHLDTDHALARVLQLQATTHPSLRIVAMSATIDPTPLARLLSASVHAVPGRQFSVHIEHAPDASRPLDRQVLRALQEQVARGLDGHVLVFLPGMRTIRATADRCRAFCAHHDLAIHRLHGDLGPAEQQAAIKASQQTKLILATNIAESSVTIDGVAVVIDSGLAQVASRHPWSGALELSTREISRDAATQRTGRAGRTREGTCIRLYSEDSFRRRPARHVPEILRADLAPLCLALAGANLSPDNLAWLDPPPSDALDGARRTLCQLGALDGDVITSEGRAMLQLPTHPRHAKLLVHARASGAGHLAAQAVAVLQEGLRASVRARGGRCDALEVYEALQHDAGAPTQGRGAMRRVVKQLSPRGGGTSRLRGEAAEDALALAMLAAYPDRVGVVVKRGTHERRVQFASGGFAMLSEDSVAAAGKFCVVVDMDRRSVGTQRAMQVRSAARLEPEWVLEHFLDDLHEQTSCRYDEDADRVVGERHLCLGAITIESEVWNPTAEAVADALALAAQKRGAGFFDPHGHLSSLHERLALLRTAGVEVPAPTDDTLEVLRLACGSVRSLAQLRKLDLARIRLASWGKDPRWLDAKLPDRIVLPSGRALKVHYDPGTPPFVASRLQDFFGMREGPSVLDGRLPLVMHLLAPNQRPVQVTTDLQGFWATHYPKLRTQLMRRYPRHAWPEDPTTAQPPSPRPRKRRG